MMRYGVHRATGRPALLPGEHLCRECQAVPLAADVPYCRACRAALRLDPTLQAVDQVSEALAMLDRPAADYVRWPWGAAQDLAGAMAPGDVWFVAAYSGNGKTTFLTSALESWRATGMGVHVLPLELRPKTWRTVWACQRVGVHPGDALSGALKHAEEAGDPYAAEQRSRIRADLDLQMTSALAEQITVSSAPVMTLQQLASEVEEAADRGARLVVVDHIDHIEPEDYQSLYAESVRINKDALKLAQRYDVTLLLASQLNNSITAGHRLAKYQPPQESHLFMGGHKVHIATGIVGLSRPTDPWADPDALDKARKGYAKPSTVLARGRMAINNVKSRNYGQASGDVAVLAVDGGRVRDLNDLERREWEGASQGITTGGEYR